ncbi:hypothetical protein CEUSTIGMA_g7948.t1 [Chlamydomonas eustigma]|uniref:Uncharacterized protein n=1 Tax=Chlamydomonas eustigma TaxID=1157962 RepID=A0A250XCM5_9CHLO|nr:hypothetical protein CEUSTIGMA_g7948.t1 [Chlamydomonas eustigma]|eukprot:GAX80510.1 hypothetical protein CEUSTIGMA_g7948.t1 [Chlamydomonas eustigma]
MAKKQIVPKSAKSLTSAQKSSDKQNKRLQKKTTAVIKQFSKFTGTGPRVRAVAILNTGKSSIFESVFLGLAAALPDSVKDSISKLLRELWSDFQENRDAAASKQLHDAANSKPAVNLGGLSEFLDYCEKHSDLGIGSASNMKDTHEQENSNPASSNTHC